MSKGGFFAEKRIGFGGEPVGDGVSDDDADVSAKSSLIFDSNTHTKSTEGNLNWSEGSNRFETNIQIKISYSSSADILKYLQTIPGYSKVPQSVWVTLADVLLAGVVAAGVACTIAITCGTASFATLSLAFIGTMKCVLPGISGMINGNLSISTAQDMCIEAGLFVIPLVAPALACGAVKYVVLVSESKISDLAARVTMVSVGAIVGAC